MSVFRLTFTGNPSSTIATLRSAIKRREETMATYQRKMKRDKAGAASWAMGCADCAADIERMQALIVALISAEAIEGE